MSLRHFRRPVLYADSPAIWIPYRIRTMLALKGKESYVQPARHRGRFSH